MSTAAMYLALGIIAYLIITYRESAYFKAIALVHRAVGIFAILFFLLPALFFAVSYVFTFVSSAHVITYPFALALSAITYLTYYFVYRFWKKPPESKQ